MGIEVGQIIEGKYRVTARIGEGGMGAVFAGEHLKLHRKVAIKSLHPFVAQDPEVITRFEREAQAAGRIGNEHILEVFDIGELPAGDRYMVMEFLDGEPMNARLTRLQRLTPTQAYPLLKQMLQGLAAAHAAGIVHRDLKPANVFILREKAGIPDYVKIIDFGISKFKSLAGDASQTRTGTIIGTPAYMSPEQARGLREADARSDIYAVGIIAYESVTGRVPFEGTSTNDLLFKIFLNEVPPVETVAADVDPAFASIVMRALAKEPSDRFATAEEFIAALDTWAQTGRGVMVIKPSELSSTIFEGRPVPAPAGAKGGPGTQGAWADSGPRTGGVAGVPSSGSTKVIVAVAIGIAISALVGVGLLAFRHGPTDKTSTAQSASDPSAHPAPAIAASPAAPTVPAAAPAPVPLPTTTAAEVATAVPADANVVAPHPAQPAAAQPAEEGTHHRSHHPPPQPTHQAVNPLDQL